ncbi:ABC transporter ATP-binding protein [Gottfriedia sp. NPDC056225]|uniref:ABC transporter ATP-binding protein n=1 Tax=Gottfriedia sp. NPDC056225 TaxID=3345751 RepID=UPI0015589D7A|nr:ABC transporter ATP-binding protein [Arthrobacter citreus]
MTLLHVKDVSGGYTRLPVIKDVSFTINKNELVGLIGLNGAGKSTTIKHILGLLKPLKGEILVNGQSFDKDPTTYRANLSYVPETPMIYEELTLQEHLEITALAYNIPENDFKKRSEVLLKTFRLYEKRKYFPSTFSKGMKQKVMIICALIVQPQLYIIDEPFLGLDPIAINDLLEILKEEKEKGAGILMSTHILSTAQIYCDSFIILHEGVIIAKGTLAELQNQYKMPNASLDEIYIFATKEREI